MNTSKRILLYAIVFLCQTAFGSVPLVKAESATTTVHPYNRQPTQQGSVYLKMTTSDGESDIFSLVPIWGKTGVYHNLFFSQEKFYSTLHYSYDKENWVPVNVSINDLFNLNIFLGWYQLIFEIPSEENYQTSPLVQNGNRSTRAKKGFAYVIGDVTGDWTAQNESWKLSIPVNGGWCASPRFVADGEVRAYVQVNDYDWQNTEFTIHDGYIYWRDCDIPVSWAESKGADYSVQGKVGQKLYVNFTTGEAMVSTPDEVPFPLENPVFRKTDTTNLPYDDPTLSGLVGKNGNSVVLRWNAIDGASGYRIKMALYDKVSEGGEKVWNAPENVLLDKTVDANTLEITINDLDYSRDYRFAIQALSPRGEQYNSDWFGYGGSRYWYAYMGITTKERYEVPKVVSVSMIEKTSVRVNLNRSIANYSEEQKETFREHFNFVDEDQTMLRVDYLTVEQVDINSDANVPAEYSKYILTDADRERGYIDIEGLDENSYYVFDAFDSSIEATVDAHYNTVLKRTKGTPGAPIILRHEALMSQAASLPIEGSELKRSDVYALAEEYNAAPISPTLRNYISDVSLTEGQTFYLEGGKTYYLDGLDDICKGFTLATIPNDVAAGKRAKVICGIGKSSELFSQAVNGEQWNGGTYALFRLGIQPFHNHGDYIDLPVEIGKISFKDIDFDNPKAFNYGDNVAGMGTASGNYFINMYSNASPIDLDSLVIENCSFKRIVRGFIREQGPNYKVWNHVLIKNNLFLDCGYYNKGAGGYSWIAGTNQPGSNLYKDFKVVENTFYDSPFPAFFSEERTDYTRDNGPWNITFSNNTLINFNTRANGSIFKMRNLPDGSVYNVHNNLFVLCKKNGDQRILQMWGADIRNTEILPNGSPGKVTLNFSNNWSTNHDLTNGSIFSGNAWTATNNSFQKLVKNGVATLNGTLKVQVANISATQLMEQPCPPHVALTDSDPNMHRADALDGTASTEYNVNLYFKDTDNDIYRNNVGASRWYNKTNPAWIDGDANGDGEISVTDVMDVIDIIAGSGTNEQQKAADVNGDGKVNVADILYIIRRTGK